MVPVAELWSGFPNGVFVILRGYIDESYDGRRIPKMFSLTCTIARHDEWVWIEFAWLKCLEEINDRLRKAGRKPIRRYHSNDINSFREDFADWTPDERKEFCEKLVRIFSRHIIGYEGYVINLEELVEEWPETSADPIAFGYYVLIKKMLFDIGVGIATEIPGAKINLFHDRCPYDLIMLQSFNEVIEDQTFIARSCFTTLAPMGWEDCIPLQPADLIAYENFKEGLRRQPGEKQRDQRKIFTELLALDSVVPRLRHANRSYIRELKKLADQAKDKTRKSNMLNYSI